MINSYGTVDKPNFFHPLQHTSASDERDSVKNNVGVFIGTPLVPGLQWQCFLLSSIGPAVIPTVVGEKQFQRNWAENTRTEVVLQPYGDLLRCFSKLVVNNLQVGTELLFDLAFE